MPSYPERMSPTYPHSSADITTAMYFVMVKPDFYFYSTETGYGLSSLRSNASTYTLDEAEAITKNYKHWQNIEVVESNAST